MFDEHQGNRRQSNRGRNDNAKPSAGINQIIGPTPQGNGNTMQDEQCTERLFGNMDKSADGFIAHDSRYCDQNGERNNGIEEAQAPAKFVAKQRKRQRNSSQNSASANHQKKTASNQDRGTMTRCQGASIATRTGAVQIM